MKDFCFKKTPTKRPLARSKTLDTNKNSMYNYTVAAGFLAQPGHKDFLASVAIAAHFIDFLKNFNEHVPEIRIFDHE